MKTRLALARSVLHDPDLLLFDEPTSGLDPESSHAVLELIREMTDRRPHRRDVHPPARSRPRAWPTRSSCWRTATTSSPARPPSSPAGTGPAPSCSSAPSPRSTRESLQDIPGVRQLEPDSDPTTSASTSTATTACPTLIVALVAHGVRLTRVEPISPTLEDLYFAVRTKKTAPGDIAEDGGRQLAPAGGGDADAPVTDRNRQVAALTGWPGSEGPR